MQRWNWFLSADYQGKWITTQGYADVEPQPGALTATLRFDGDGDVYHYLSAKLDDDDGAEAVVTSPRGDVEPFELGGQLFRGDIDDGIEPMMLLLTDGTTVLGLTFGPLSQESGL